MSASRPSASSLVFILGVVWGSAIVLSSCSGAPEIWRRHLDVDRAERALLDRLDDPQERSRAHIELVWLCLLHGRACDVIDVHGRAAVIDAPDGALARFTRALSLQVSRDVGARASAWMALLRWRLERRADVSKRDASGILITVAVEALARLAVRDRAAVRALLVKQPAVIRDLLRRGAPVDRWRRLRALGPLLPPNLSPSEALVIQPRATHLVAPVSRRLYSGLRSLEGPPATSGWQPLPLAPSALHLPSSSRIGRYLLPAPSPGIYAQRFVWRTLRPGPHTLVWQMPRSMRLWLDGRELHSSVGEGGRSVGGEGGGLGYLPLHRVVLRYLEPGTHRLEVLTALPSGGAPLQLAVLSGGDPVRALPLSWPLPVRAAVRALDRGAGDAAELLRRDFDRGPLAAMIALDRAASLRLEGRASAALLDRVLDRLPQHFDARLDRAGRARDDGNLALARRLLPRPSGQGSRAASRRADVWLERAWQRQAEGLGDRAMRAVERALVAQPEDCELWRLALVLGQDVLDRAALRRLLARRPSCLRGTLDLADAQALTGALGAAASTLRGTSGQPALRRESLERLERIDDILAVAGLPARVSETQVVRPEPALGPAPGSAASPQGLSPASRRWRRVQRALISGRRSQAARLLRETLTGPGRDQEPRRLAWTLGARPPWQGLIVRGRDVVAASRDRPAGGAALTWLLDQEIVLMLPGGGALRRVHQMARVHTAQAAEALGELRVPPNAELLFARTWTPDGALILPADTPDKTSVSLRKVSPGAVVEYAQLQFVEADDLATAATRLPAFLFQAADGPVLRSEYIVLAPAGMKLQIAASPSAPRPESGRQGSLQRWIYRYGPVSRYRREPFANRAAWSLPMVRLSRGATRQSVAEVYEEVLAAQEGIRAPILGSWVRRARWAGRDPTRWRALIAEVAAKVSQRRATLMPGDPLSALREEQGDRASLLYHLARRAGVSVCLVRLLPLVREPPYGAPDPVDYSLDALTLRLRGPGGALREYWVDPGVEGGPLDFLRPGLRGRAGLRLGCDLRGEARQVRAPTLGGERDLRQVRVELDWFADGRVEVQVRERLRGALAAFVRGLLRDDSEKMRDELLGELASAAFPGMTLAWQGAEGLADLAAPLVLRYRVHAPAARSRSLALELGLYPTGLGRRYARLARRRTVLRFGQAWDIDLELIVRSHGSPLVALPPPISVVGPLLSLKREVESTGGMLRLRHRLKTRMGLVAPRDYPAVAARLRRMDQAEGLVLRRGASLKRR